MESNYYKNMATTQHRNRSADDIIAQFIDIAEKLIEKFEVYLSTVYNFASRLKSDHFNLLALGIEVKKVKDDVYQELDSTNIKVMSEDLQVCSADELKNTPIMKLFDEGLTKIIDKVDMEKKNTEEFANIDLDINSCHLKIFKLKSLKDELSTPVKERENSPSRFRFWSGHLTSKEDTVKGMKWALSRIKPMEKPHQEIGVIGFNDETISKHVDLTKTVLGLDSVDQTAAIPVTSRLINGHEDVPDLPDCNTFVMYVDYNQRNTILEDRYTMGDLKLTTAKAVQKKKADLILVYVGDKGSEHLQENALYNTRLVSDESAQELQDLTRVKKFLSIKNDFSEHQNDHISAILRRNVEIAKQQIGGHPSALPSSVNASKPGDTESWWEIIG